MSAEQQARDLLARMDVPGAQDMSSGDVVELANLLAELARVRRIAVSVLAAVETWDTGLTSMQRRSITDALRAIAEQPRTRIDGYRPYHGADCPARTAWWAQPCTCGGLARPLWETGPASSAAGAT